MACNLHQFKGQPVNGHHGASLDEFGTAPLFTDPLAQPETPTSTTAPRDGGPRPVRFHDALSLPPTPVSRSEQTTSERKNS